MFFKTLCLLLALAVVAYGRPYEHHSGGQIDPGFSRYPNQGFAPDPGFGNGHGQGGFPSQGGFAPDPGFSHGNGQGGLPGPDDLHYGGSGGFQLRSHKHGYQEHGY